MEAAIVEDVAARFPCRPTTRRRTGKVATCNRLLRRQTRRPQTSKARRAGDDSLQPYLGYCPGSFKAGSLSLVDQNDLNQLCCERRGA